MPQKTGDGQQQIGDQSFARSAVVLVRTPASALVAPSAGRRSDTVWRGNRGSIENLADRIFRPIENKRHAWVHVRARIKGNAGRKS
jgi:hypothetical protein